MQRPPFMMGEPPGVGSAWPWRITGTVRQNAEPLLASSPSSVVDFRNDAAATALACAARTDCSACSSVSSIMSSLPCRISFGSDRVREQLAAMLVEHPHGEVRGLDLDLAVAVDAALGEQRARVEPGVQRARPAHRCRQRADDEL